MKIEPIILNEQFEQLAVIDDYISLIWTTRYYKCGDFEICIDINMKNSDIFKKDFYIMREDDENIGIIEDIEIQTNEDNKEMVIVSGRFISSLLARRIIATQTQLNGTVSNGIYNLLLDNVINPTIPERKIDNFIYRATNFNDKLTAQYTGKNLLETIESICETYFIGFKTILVERDKLEFTLYKGTDRSYNQEENQHIIFSDEYDNLLSSNYKESYQEMITDVLVAGEGEGIDRKTLWVSKKNETGINRYEYYQDQRNINTNSGNITDEEYYKQLEEEGLETITPYTTAFEGQVYFENIEYKKDVFMGDICTIENTHWGIYINSRLIEVIEAVDEQGTYSINPLFGL